MSAFIKLNKQDAYINTYTAYKSWHVSSSNFEEYGIGYYLAVSGSSTLTGNVSEIEAGALYNSLKHLYYSGTVTGALLTASLYEDYQQTTLFASMSRSLPDTSLVLAIPQNIFGDAIRPGTFAMGTDEPIQEYVSGAYINTGYFKPGLPNGYNIYDDGEGKVRVSGSNQEVGDIIYTHGIVTITDSTAIANINRLLEPRWMIGQYESYVSSSYVPTGYFIVTNTGDVVEVAGCYLESELEYLDDEYFVDCTRSCVGQPMLPAPPIGFNVRWNSTLPVYTRTYRCKVRSEQLNHTFNYSASSGSLMSGSNWLQVSNFDDLTLNDNITGSYFQPYVTTVGLYNDAHELVAVGKLAQPTPKSKYTDMTFVINLDI